MATGKQIKHYREKLQWTLQELSDICDVDVGTISALENRDSSRSKFFNSIAYAFGLTVEQLSNENEEHQLRPPSGYKYEGAASVDLQPTHRYAQGRDAVLTNKSFVQNDTPQQYLNQRHGKWIQAAIGIMKELDEGQQQAMVAKMREYKQFLGPPSDGQTLSMAG